MDASIGLAESPQTHQIVQDIKRRFRLLMDGQTASSMRDKGVGYHLNWGVSQVMLRQMASEVAEELAQDAETLYSVAIALFKEDIRECKLLATMLMPQGVMKAEVACLWVEQTTWLEVAEAAAMNVYPYLAEAGDLAFLWIASEEDLPQLTGYHVLARLFSQGRQPEERAINEFIDQALCALGSSSLPVRKAAMNAVMRFAQLGLVYQRMAHGAMLRAGYDFV